MYKVTETQENRSGGQPCLLQNGSPGLLALPWFPGFGRKDQKSTEEGKSHQVLSGQGVTDGGEVARVG